MVFSNLSWFGNGILKLITPTKKPMNHFPFLPPPNGATKGKDYRFRYEKFTGNSKKVSKQRVTATILITKFLRNKKLFTWKAPDNKQIPDHSVCQVLSTGRSPISPEETERVPFYHPWKLYEMVKNNIHALDVPPPGFCRKINPVLAWLEPGHYHRADTMDQDTLTKYTFIYKQDQI